MEVAHELLHFLADYKPSVAEVLVSCRSLIVGDNYLYTDNNLLFLDECMLSMWDVADCRNFQYKQAENQFDAHEHLAV